MHLLHGEAEADDFSCYMVDVLIWWSNCYEGATNVAGETAMEFEKENFLLVCGLAHRMQRPGTPATVDQANEVAVMASSL